ncbi:MAG: cytochrome c [Acidobacteria bacterium]|nr:cytochrome c [Acidobacteriota bacterium]
MCLTRLRLLFAARRSTPAFLLVVLSIAFSACRQDMADQPKQKPLTASLFFADGSARQPVEGTVPHGSIEDDHLNVSPDDPNFPVALTPELLARGKERYTIYCSVCHGALGDGNGMIVRRGYRTPPSYHIERLRRAPVGHFYDVVTHGFGLMPEYATLIPPRDRWAIVAYVRALQISQYANVAQLPPEHRQRVESTPSGTPPQEGSR